MQDERVLPAEFLIVKLREVGLSKTSGRFTTSTSGDLEGSGKYRPHFLLFMGF